MDSLLTLIQKSLKRVAESNRDAEVVAIEKIGENLTPNMRALRLTMDIADRLLSMEAAASDVVHMALGITNMYCTRRVHIDISYTMLTISQDRGVDREPLTVIRTITPRATHYQTVQRLQELCIKIRDSKMSLDAAEQELDTILAAQRYYPAWVTHIAGGGISAGVSILYTGSMTIVGLSFLLGMFTSWILGRMGRLGVPAFFMQVIAATTITLIAGGITWAVESGYLEIISYINPTLLIVGGIVLLLAGMMIVNAFQDAIDEYYLTASARILKVLMMTGAIVMGVAAGLYIAKQLDINFLASPERLTLTSINYQYIGAAMIASAFALGNHSRLMGVIIAGATGMLGYYFFLLFINLGFDSIPSYGMAAAFIGLSATLISRLWRVPSMATISAGIIPLVPGLTLYNGLMLTIQNAPGTASFDEGLGTLLRALLIALSIAAGASFGNILGRPMRRKLIQLQNKLPRRRLSPTIPIATPPQGEQDIVNL
jgi:uncharacterized membrane protein YjjP (DUF1212 family)